MSNSESTTTPNNSPAAPPAPFVLPDEITKHTVRRTVWLGLERARLVNYPRPCWAMIPNFKGSEIAAEKLTELEEFKNAKVLKVNPDKPQEPVRAAILKNKKELVVPIPRFSDGFLRSVILGEDATPSDIKNASSYKEMTKYSKPIELETKIKIDLVVMGSVAVSKEGHRVGKGEGFADLEYAMMMHLKAVTPDTLVVTTVHDNQVFDTLPSDLFKDFDVPVDIIVTPTQVIRVGNRLSKPKGLLWSILSQRRLDSIPVLQKLREIDEKDGKDVTLKVETSDADRPKQYRPLLKNRYRTRRPRQNATSESQDEGAAGEGARPKRRRNLHRRTNRPAKKDGSGEPAQNGVDEKAKNDKTKTKKRDQRLHRKRNAIDFSLRVDNIDKNVRVRDLKAALAERGVKPNEITWRGYKGFCLLHFAKPSPKNKNKDGTGETAAAAASVAGGGDNSVGVDNILESLHDLKLSPNSEKILLIEPAKPISRIETTDVTTV